jgi:hypothetical protein
MYPISCACGRFEVLGTKWCIFNTHVTTDGEDEQ